MKINFTYNNKNYTICTVKEFADILAEKAYKEETSGKTKFIADFTIIDIENNDAIDINNIGHYAEEATEWCGVKELGEIGFNDTAKQFVFDYYGGNQMIMNTFPDEYMKEDYFMTTYNNKSVRPAIIERTIKDMVEYYKKNILKL